MTRSDPVEATQVACCQIAPVVGDLDGNLARCTEAIVHAVSNGATVVVLPELATSGYVFDSLAEATASAIDAHHAVFAHWSALAGSAGAVVIVGFCEQGNEDRLYNSAAVVDGTGVRATYRKAHLWGDEGRYFVPGDSIAPVLATAAGPIGVCICYDLEFPEVPRTLALRGARLIAVPTNWPFSFRPEGERPAEVGIAMAAARVNKVAIACCDRSGEERGQRWNESSTIIGSDGWVHASADESGIALAELDLTRGLDVAPRSLRGRRPSLYRALAEEQES